MYRKVTSGPARQFVVPPEMDKVLSWQVNKIPLNAAGINAMVRFSPNSAYDVDPVFGSTSTPGFSEWAALYSYYRVVKIGYRLQIVNNETFAVRVYTIFTNTDPGTVGNSQFPGNPLAKDYLLSAKGGQDRCLLKDTKQVAQITGARGVEDEDNYRAAVTASPTDLVWLGVGANTVGASFLANGVSVAGYIKMWVRFYGPKSTFI